MKTTYLLMLYVGFVAGSLQVLAFSDKWEVLGVLLLVTIILIFILGAMSQRPAKKGKAIPRRASVARNSRAGKSKLKVVKS